MLNINRFILTTHGAVDEQSIAALRGTILKKTVIYWGILSQDLFISNLFRDCNHNKFIITTTISTLDCNPNYTSY